MRGDLFSSARCAATRRPILRILQIHAAIHANRFPNCSTLSREIEVGRKPILRDISFMRDECNLPIDYDAAKQGYFYTEPVDQLPLLRLGKRDLMALFLAKKALEPMRGTRLAAVLAESFEKIASMCSGEIAFQWRELDHFFSVHAAGAVEADLNLFSDLCEAVQEQRELEFDYRKPSASKSDRRLVQPWILRQVHQAWYLTGFDLNRKKVRTFALHRIREQQVQKTKFKRPRDSEIEEHFKESFGVWTYDGDEAESSLVKIRFSGYAAEIVPERIWHPTQKIVRDGEFIELHMKLRGAG